MNSGDVFSLFKSINVRKTEGKYSLYKPLLLFYTLSKCYSGEQRLIEFSKIEIALSNIVNKFFEDLEHKNFHYAFGRLENDDIWEVENCCELKHTNSGDLIRPELLIKKTHGGFTQEIYQALLNDKTLLLNIADHLLNRYFPLKLHKALLSAVGLPEVVDQITTTMMVCDTNMEGKNNGTISSIDDTGERYYGDTAKWVHCLFKLFAQCYS